jgi:hypothetical protein
MKCHAVIGKKTLYLIYFSSLKKGRDNGIHFGTKEQAKERGGILIEAFLNIPKLKRVTDKMDGQRSNITQAKKEEYDGLVYANIFEGEGDSYVAFRLSQIKSATANNGNFDEKSDDIRYQFEGNLENSGENSTYGIFYESNHFQFSIFNLFESLNRI